MMMKKIIFTFLLVTAFFCSYADSWIQRSSITGVRDGAVGFSIGTKGYIGTGYNSGLNQWYQDFWEWDQANNVWTQKSDFAGGNRAGAVGFSIGTRGYIGLGLAPALMNDFWEWDQATNIWTQKVNYAGNSRTGAVAFSIGTKGYIGTGSTNGTAAGLVTEFWEWEGDTSAITYNTWTQKSDFAGAARAGASGFSIGNKGYIGTGSTDGTTAGGTRDFWEWDQSSNAWSQKADFGGMERGAAAAFTIGKKGYIGTGAIILGPNVKDFWEWDGDTTSITYNTWTQKADFGGPHRSLATGFSISSKGYIGMGFFFTVSTNDFWEYCDTCAGVGIGEINNSTGISVLSNPVSDKLKISVDKNYKNLKIAIHNTMGQKVFERALRNINILLEIDVSKYSRGIYFLKLDDGNSCHTAKVLLE